MRDKEVGTGRGAREDNKELLGDTTDEEGGRRKRWRRRDATY